MTRDPLTDPQPGDVVRGDSDEYRCTARDGDRVSWECSDHPGIVQRGTVVAWADWSLYETKEVVCLGGSVEAARLAAEAAEAEVRACSEALEAARRRQLEAYAEWVSAVRREHAEALRVLRS